MLSMFVVTLMLRISFFGHPPGRQFLFLSAFQMPPLFLLNLSLKESVLCHENGGSIGNGYFRSDQLRMGGHRSFSTYASGSGYRFHPEDYPKAVTMLLQMRNDSEIRKERLPNFHSYRVWRCTRLFIRM